MEYITPALNILFFVFLGFGLIFGFTRGLKRTAVRSVWIIFIICLLIPLSLNITGWLLEINITLNYEGQACANIHEYLLAVFKHLIPVEGGNYAGLVDICMFLVSLLLNGIIFLLCYWILKLVTMPLYWIFNIFIFAGEKRKKKRAKREKQKIKIKKYRLAGALVGVVLGLISFCLTMTPIMGYINIAKVVEKETAVEGNGVLSENIGDIYNDALNAYESSIPISLMNSVGVDNVLLTVFDGITTSKIGNKRIVLKDEAVSLSKIYNEVKDVNLPDFQTITQAEFNEALNKYESIINVIFNSQLIASTSDVIIPFGIAYARENIKTDNFKPYVLSFYNSLFDEMENLNSSSAKHELNNILGLVKTLNDNNLLLPIIQTPDAIGVEYLKTTITKNVSDQIVEELFSINTVNNVAPALVNFLLGFGAEQLGYDYSSENAVTSEALKQSVNVLMTSVVDLLQNYNEESSTKVELNEITIGALGGMLDEIKGLLSVENFSSVVNALEPKLEEIALNAMSEQPQFLQDTVKEAIGNISDIDSYKTSLLNVYGAIKEVEKQFEDAKVDDSYDVQYMDFIKIGGAIDDIQNSGLFKNDLLLKTMKGAIEYYSEEIEANLSESDKTFNFTFDTQLISNINEISADDFVWEGELPKYKNTFGIFINLFQNEGNLFDKLKSDSDATLEELGAEFDSSLKNSILFKEVDRPLVADLLTLADLMVNTSEDEDLSNLLDDAKTNVLNENVDIDWEDEFFHIKQLIKLEFDDVSDNSLLTIGSTIDKIVFDYDNGDRVVKKSAIFTKGMINNFIAKYMDNVFEGVEEESDFYSTIQLIKSGFTTQSIESYRNEINALLKLKEAKDLVDADGFDFMTGTPKGAVALGKKLDEAIALNSEIVDYALINDFITKQLDSYFSDYSDMQDEITKIKLGFNEDIEKYEVEFTALLNLMSISDTANASDFDFNDIEQAKTLGKSIDTALGTVNVGGTNYTSLVVTRELINGYIKKYISNNITLDEGSQFANIIETIIGVKTGDEFGQGRIDTMSNYTYEAEFGYLSHLLTVSEVFVNIDISNINGEVLIDSSNPNSKTTIADQFDGHDGTEGRIAVYDPLRNSYLVGDSLLAVIDSALETYATTNADYVEILNEVNRNYDSYKEHVVWAGNTNGGLYYTNLIDAFDEINSTLNGRLTDEISSVSDLLVEVEDDITLANYYDAMIYSLQGDGESNYGNILLATNGTNKLIKFVLNKVKKVLETNNPTYFTDEINYIEDYIEFLNGYLPVNAEEKLDVKYYYLPYGTTEDVVYAYLIDETEQVFGTESINNHSGIQINTPFTYISELKINA